MAKMHYNIFLEISTTKREGNEVVKARFQIVLVVFVILGVFFVLIFTVSHMCVRDIYIYIYLSLCIYIYIYKYI